jgi:hypothetical protein
VDERIDQLGKEGHTDIRGANGPDRLPEKRIPTPDGEKQWRQPDISSKGPDGKDYYENIGKSRADGSPVSRERRAINDIGGETGVIPKFTPYDR